MVAETQRQIWRNRLRQSNISISSDGSGPFDVVDFEAYDGKCWQGTLGLAKYHFSAGQRLKKPTMSEDEAKKASQSLADGIMSVIKTFCTEGCNSDKRMQMPGRFSESLFKTVCDGLLCTSFDGAPYVQVTARILCDEHFPNPISAEKDTFHDIIRIIDESAKKDSDWNPIREELITKKQNVANS